MAASGSILGNAVLRREDPTILDGSARYYDDLQVDGLTHIVFVRSTIAHAVVFSIDTADAATMPGVIAVYTASTLPMDAIQGFIMLPPAFNRPPLQQTGCGSSATSWPRWWPGRARRRWTRPSR